MIKRVFTDSLTLELDKQLQTAMSLLLSIKIRMVMVFIQPLNVQIVQIIICARKM